MEYYDPSDYIMTYNNNYIDTYYDTKKNKKYNNLEDFEKILDILDKGDKPSSMNIENHLRKMDGKEILTIPINIKSF